MTGRQGFASMTPERRLELARKGGAAVPANRRTFTVNRALAAAAGRAGGKGVKASDRSFARDLVLASEAGRKGGLATQRRRRAP
jgi:general stress protein YciG